MKKNIFLLTLFLCFLITTSAQARYEGKHLSLGVSGSYGFGSIAANEDSDKSFDSATFMDLNGQLAFRFTKVFELRLTGGWLNVNNQDRQHDLTDFGNVELAALFHFTQPKIFAPYALVGVGLPRLVHVGLGSEFYVTPQISPFVEVQAATVLFINMATVRAGVSFHF